MLDETTQADVTHVNHVLLEAVVERSPLDTFDLWTRFEALPRLRRHGLLGDAASVRSLTGELPRFAPSALTFVDGPDGYAGTVWIRRLALRTTITPGTTDAGSSVVVLGVDHASSAGVAARDLARFVEFVLVDGLDRELECVLPRAPRVLTGRGTDAPEPNPIREHPIREHPIRGNSFRRNSIRGLPPSRRGHRDR